MPANIPLDETGYPTQQQQQQEHQQVPEYGLLQVGSAHLVFSCVSGQL